MITNHILCRHCGSPNISKYGVAPNGKQKYRISRLNTCIADRLDRGDFGTQKRSNVIPIYQCRLFQPAANTQALIDAAPFTRRN
jgi:hypothetical protein